MKRILILGNTSLLGRRLVRKLSVENHIVTAGRNETADIYFDLAEGPPDLPDDLNCDVLVHCASSFGDDTLAGAVENERVNSLGAFHVAGLASRTSCKHLIFISSISAYRHPENEYYGSYGMSKAHAEDNLAFSCSLLNITFTALRLSQLYDESGEARRHQAFFYHLIDKVSKGQDITLFGSKDRLRNYIYVDDAAEVIEKVIGSAPGGSFPVIFPESYSLTRIVRTACEVFGSRSRISFLEDKPDIKSVYIPTSPELYSLVGYVPETDLRKGISMIRDSLYQAGGGPPQ